jgi:hypothetical protein
MKIILAGKSTCRCHRKATKTWVLERVMNYQIARAMTKWPLPFNMSFQYTLLVVFYEDDMSPFLLRLS